MQPRQLKNLADGVAGIPQAQLAPAAARGLVQGDQRTQAATVEEGRFREINLDVFLGRAQRRARFVAQGVAIRRAEFQHFADVEGVAGYFEFHTAFSSAQNLSGKKARMSLGHLPCSKLSQSRYDEKQKGQPSIAQHYWPELLLQCVQFSAQVDHDRSQVV